jgi:hypothetical protein
MEFTRPFAVLITSVTSEPYFSPQWAMVKVVVVVTAFVVGGDVGGSVGSVYVGSGNTLVAEPLLVAEALVARLRS